ncbi:MAG TPA: hypothetical protein VFU81_00860, partial [Thermomicrobiales bacterium]|nr:hypothetical protein [Thermomicrobiales bacterium]
MKSLRAHPLPATLFGLCFVMTAGAYLLMALNWLSPRYEPTSMELWWFATWPAMFLAYPIVGALIAARQPRNSIGWLFCALGLLWALGFLATAYGAFGLKARPGAVPGAMAADWFQSWSFFPGLGLALIYAPLLFPNGRPLGPRWRLVAWTGAVGIALTSVVFAFEPGPLDDGIGGFPNPYGILPDPLAMLFAVVGFALTFGSAVAAATSMALRLRRARGVEREQLKWIAFAAAILTVAFACHLTLQFSGLADRVEWYGALWGMALCGLPIAAGIAIFRRGLFDIDVIIGRTLVYAALTGIVGGGYIAIVAGAGALLRQQGGFVLPLAATGVVAVAFQPLRERLQRGVNRILYGDRDDPYAV